MDHLYPIQTLDELNNPLGQVTISITSHGDEWNGVSDECGWYIPFLPADTYTAQFSKEGYVDRTLVWELEENPREPILVGLQVDGTTATNDMIPINEITWVNGPNFAEFKLATKLTELKLADDCYVNFDKEDGPNRWPDSTTPDWEGPLQYSMGLVMKIDGKWYGCAPIELWYGKAGGGGPIQSQDIGNGKGQIEANWFYNSSWSPLNTHQPKAGEQLGFFVCAGDARNNYCPLKERSQIVTFRLPAEHEVKTFTY